jgi:hypothetical protein
MEDIYIYSEILQQKIKYSPKTELVTVNDRNADGKLITYTVEEIQLIKESKIDDIQLLHNIKKAFSGTITKKEAEIERPNN